MTKGFKHKAFYGITGCGKTWTLKRRASILLKYKQRVIVYSGVIDPAWPKHKNLTVCYDADALEALLSDPGNHGAYVIIDEGSILFDDVKKDRHPLLYRAFQMARHMGYTFYIATQFPTSIPRKVRLNCGEIYCFRLGDEDAAKEVYRDLGCPVIAGEPLYKRIVQLPP